MDKNKSILFRRPDSFLWIFLVLVVLYILPVWIFDYFPTQDGPSHIYNSFILKHYNDPDYIFNQYYDLQIKPFPNWTSHVILTMLMFCVTPLIAEKILLTTYIMLMSFSMLYMVHSVDSKGRILAFLGFPFIYNYIFLMGFYNFSIGLAIFILILGYCWVHITSFNAVNMVILSLLLLILYFCHPVPLVLALLSIATIGLVNLLMGASTLKNVLMCFICTLPSTGLILYFVQTSGTGWNTKTYSLSYLWHYFFWNESLAYHSPSQLVFGKIVTGVFLLLIFYTLLKDHFFTHNWHLSFRLLKRDLFLLLGTIFFFIYLKSPDSMSGGGSLKTRLAFLPFLVIIPWLSLNMPKALKTFIGSLLYILSIAYIVHVSYYHKIINDEIKVYTSGYDYVDRNKVILPIGNENFGKSWRIGVFTHTSGYYGYERGGINLINYEAETNYFPTHFKTEFYRPTVRMIQVKQKKINFRTYDNIDYVITWALVSGSKLEKRIMKFYLPVLQNGKLRIYKRD